MATVYLAHAGGPGRFQKHVALKRIHAHLASRRDFVEMFHDEAAIAARISHPNVAAVFDFGEENGVHYLAMEYLLGESLSRVLRACRKQPAIDWDAHSLIVARIVADMCEGLHAAHELRDEHGELLDVVHRDVSPDNVFVTYDGVVKLVDFGVASARNRITHTTTGVLKGKHAYMAPELLSEGGFDRRADLFAVGVVLWEGLTLRRLFRRESEAKTLFAVVGDPIEPPSSMVPGLDPALDAIAMRALARDPSDRYSTAREISHDLRNYLLDRRTDVTSADIEGWLGELFPDGLSERRALLASVDRIVAEDGSSPSGPASSSPRAEQTGGKKRLLAMLGALFLAFGATGALVWAWRNPPPSDAGESNTGAAGTVESSGSGSAGNANAPPPPVATATVDTTLDAEAGDAGRDAGPHPVETAAPRRARSSQSRPAPRARAAAPARPPEGPPGELRVGLRAAAGGLLPDDAWAEVRVDGRAVDGSPPFTLRLAPGRHVVEVKPYGRGRALRRTIEIEPGGRENRDLRHRCSLTRSRLSRSGGTATSPSMLPDRALSSRGRAGRRRWRWSWEACRARRRSSSGCRGGRRRSRGGSGACGWRGRRLPGRRPPWCRPSS